MIIIMKKNILVIDDSALMRRLISDIINSDNRFNTLDIAHNGLEAYDLITLSPQKYDAILLDINMPKMSGLSFLKELRERGDETPVVILSGYGDKSKVTQALRLGALDFLDKPFEDKTVIDVVGRAIEYGSSLKQFDQLFENLANNSRMSQEDLEKFKLAKKQIWLMRFESDYFKKKAS